MKLNRTPALWTLFFTTSLVIFASIAYFYIEPREIVLDESKSNIIGFKIAKNEKRFKQRNLISWPSKAPYSRLGIAHFEWHSEITNDSSEMSFAGFLRYTSKEAVLPDWLLKVELPPWTSHQDFLLSKHDPFKRQLSQFLRETTKEQAQYLAKHLESRLPKMLMSISHPFSKMHIHENFYHMVMQANGVFVMADYYIFQGDGTSLNDRYNKQGWGLLQVLDHMGGKSNNLTDEFIRSADLLLTRRVSNAPTDESALLPPWLERLSTYREISSNFAQAN